MEARFYLLLELDLVFDVFLGMIVLWSCTVTLFSAGIKAEIMVLLVGLSEARDIGWSNILVVGDDLFLIEGIKRNYQGPWKYDCLLHDLLTKWQISLPKEKLSPKRVLDVCPTFGGSNPGLQAELIHSVKEQLSLICGCAFMTSPVGFMACPSAFASVSVDLGMSLTPGNVAVLCSKLPISTFQEAILTGKRYDGSGATAASIVHAMHPTCPALLQTGINKDGDVQDHS